MAWHALCEGETKELKELARRYQLHPLHIEDCEHGGQNAKVEETEDYHFIILKPVRVIAPGELEIGDFDIFLGKDFVVTYEETGCSAIKAPVERLHANVALSPPQVLYRLMDSLVDSYFPILDNFNEQINEIEDLVIATPDPKVPQRIFTLKRGLIEMRRVLTQSRDVTSHLLRVNETWIPDTLKPYFRDIFDHLSRGIEAVEMARDLLSGALDIYLTSVSNRTNQTMKVLTMFSAAALPAVVIASFFGMNFEFMPWIKQPDGLTRAVTVMVSATIVLGAISKWRKWI